MTNLICLAPIKAFSAYCTYPILDANPTCYLVADNNGQQYWLSKRFIEHGLFALRGDAHALAESGSNY